MKRLYKGVNLGYFGESKYPVKTTAAKGGESKLVSRKVRESLNGQRYTWNLTHPIINGCFNWMIPILYIGNCYLTKHPFQII